jgi:hypothetical protein
MPADNRRLRAQPPLPRPQAAAYSILVKCRLARSKSGETLAEAL